MGRKKTTSEFIEQSIQIHNNKYDYSLTKYNGVKDRVKIICEKHGVFEQLPSNHLKGKGCRRCGGSAKLNTDEFIKKSKLIHGDKYDYSLTKYINTKTKVNIICQKHGAF